MNLSDKVKQRREELGFSQEQLALKMGYSSRTSINKIENGRPCSQKIIVRLADALNVSVPYLMGWDESEAAEDKKEKPTVHDDGLTDSQRKLIEYAMSLSEEKADRVLRVFQAMDQLGESD